ncbi:MAG: glucuronyl hydrolase [Bacteroidetes bacterium]|nr:glucuronyl hydrolase [Bacteroidota bacterium]
MTTRLGSIAFFLFSFFSLQAQQSDSSLIVKIRNNMQLAVEQYKLLDANVPEGRMPQNFSEQSGKLVTSNTKWWCAGFFPGTLWYIFEYTKDPAIRALAEKRLKLMEPEKHFKSNHDLGFMMYCSFGNAYRITGDPSYKATIDTSAMSLATRFRPGIQSIQSWDSSKNFSCAVIVDNMMNLELLTWVSNNGGDQLFRDIAVTHANTTIERQFRPNNSAYHVLDYSLAQNKLLRKTTWQGAHDTSAWARGQAWALYGFTMMYRLTRDTRYLDQANKIAAFVLNHGHLPKDGIPFWDFDAKEIPNTFRDASAAAILASALIELSAYVSGSLTSSYLLSAETMLNTLSSETYLAKQGTNGGFLLKHSVGALPLNGEVDVALTYADYYFVEAMLRYLARKG